METKKRVAIFGGSFNPIHNGHIALAQSVINQGLADEVWLLVSPQNPLKKQGDLLDEQKRLTLAERALDGEKHIKVSDFEFTLPRPSYTWNTLQALSRAYPECKFKLLVGADNWKVFDKWAHYNDILSHYELLVYPREGYDINAASLPPSVSLIHAPLFPISSTDIRHMVHEGEDIQSYIPIIIEEDVKLLYS